MEDDDKGPASPAVAVSDAVKAACGVTDELWDLILSLLAPDDIVLRAILVCKQWKRIISTRNGFWKRVCINDRLCESDECDTEEKEALLLDPYGSWATLAATRHRSIRLLLEVLERTDTFPGKLLNKGLPCMRCVSRNMPTMLRWALVEARGEDPSRLGKEDLCAVEIDVKAVDRLVSRFAPRYPTAYHAEGKEAAGWDTPMPWRDMIRDACEFLGVQTPIYRAGFTHILSERQQSIVKRRVSDRNTPVLRHKTENAVDVISRLAKTLRERFGRTVRFSQQVIYLYDMNVGIETTEDRQVRRRGERDDMTRARKRKRGEEKRRGEDRVLRMIDMDNYCETQRDPSVIHRTTRGALGFRVNLRKLHTNTRLQVVWSHDLSSGIRVTFPEWKINATVFDNGLVVLFDASDTAHDQAAFDRIRDEIERIGCARPKEEIHSSYYFSGSESEDSDSFDE